MRTLKTVLKASLLSFMIILSFSTSSFAGKECTICHTEIRDKETKLTCASGHEIHGECLAFEAKTLAGEITSEKARELSEQGLPCHFSGCTHKHTMDTVKAVIGSTEAFKGLDKQLSEDLNPDRGGAKSAAAAEDPHTVAVREFKNKVEDSFNLCCPGKTTAGGKCGGVLDKISGCEAATCESCRTQFCNLCLKQTEGDAHDHVMKHSGDYWEWRDGHTGKVPDRDYFAGGGNGSYTETDEYDVLETNPATGKKETKRVQVPYTYKDRYHWQVIRSKLQALFIEEKDETVKSTVLAQLEPLLRRSKMWPLPFEKSAEAWIEEVVKAELHKDKELNQKNRIALLQNEYIYLKEAYAQVKTQVIFAGAVAPLTSFDERHPAVHAMTAIEVRLRELKAPVLASLDVGHGGAAAAPANQFITPILEHHEDPDIRRVYAQLRDNVPGFFEMRVVYENLYRITDPNPDEERRVPPFILSGIVPDRLSHENAIRYCTERGATLPAKEQLEALSRAMSPGGRYDVDTIPWMRDVFYWSSSVRLFPDNAYFFHW